MKNKTWLLLLLIPIIALVIYLERKKSIAELEGNIRALKDNVMFYKNSDSLSAASVEQLTVSFNELEKYYIDLANEAEALRLNVKRLETASRTGIKTVIEFVTEFKDSLIYIDESRIDTIRCASYYDTWVAFEMCENNARIAVTDTLVQFVHRVPRQFWFIKFGVKAVRQDITTKNPYTEITFTEYIKLRRK